MDIISDMTRQYKSVEEQLMNKLNRLHNQCDENRRETEDLEKRKADLEKECQEIA